MIDEIITLIRGSESADAARTALKAAPFEFSEVQASHILDMALRRLAALERQKLHDEYEELRATIAELEAILADEQKLRRRHQGRARRRPRQVRRRPPHADQQRPGRARRPRPHRGRRARRRAVAPWLREDGLGRPVPYARPRRQRCARRQPPRRGLRRALARRAPRTRTCCSSRTAAGSTACARTRSR